MDLKTIRAELEARLATQVEREARIDAHIHNVDREIPKDWDDAAIVRENDEVVDALEGHTRHEINLLRAAIARIDADTYGACVRCDADIEPKRLAAMPEAPFCLACAEAVGASHH